MLFEKAFGKYLQALLTKEQLKGRQRERERDNVRHILFNYQPYILQRFRLMYHRTSTGKQGGGGKRSTELKNLANFDTNSKINYQLINEQSLTKISNLMKEVKKNRKI